MVGRGAHILDADIHHDVAVRWFDDVEPDLATCPITEGTLLRFLIREGWRALDAVAVLESMRTQPWHRFWPDAVPFEAAHLAGVIGHRQVTDAYVVALARRHRGQVATLDKGLAAWHGDAAHLLTA
jgi:predicted nucleic acid-binding protein